MENFIKRFKITNQDDKSIVLADFESFGITSLSEFVDKQQLENNGLSLGKFADTKFVTYQSGGGHKFAVDVASGNYAIFPLHEFVRKFLMVLDMIGVTYRVEVCSQGQFNNEKTIRIAINESLFQGSNMMLPMLEISYSASTHSALHISSCFMTIICTNGANRISATSVKKRSGAQLSGGVDQLLKEVAQDFGYFIETGMLESEFALFQQKELSSAHGHGLITHYTKENGLIPQLSKPETKDFLVSYFDEIVSADGGEANLLHLYNTLTYLPQQKLSVNMVNDHVFDLDYSLPTPISGFTRPYEYNKLTSDLSEDLLVNIWDKETAMRFRRQR